MRARRAEFGDTAIAHITFTPRGQLAAYARRHGAPFPLLSDVKRSVYRTYGFGRGSVWNVWGPRSAARYAQLIAKGARPELPRTDTLQLGGDVVIGRDGRVQLVHIGDGPADRPSIDDLLAAVRPL